MAEAYEVVAQAERPATWADRWRARRVLAAAARLPRARGSHGGITAPFARTWVRIGLLGRQPARLLVVMAIAEEGGSRFQGSVLPGDGVVCAGPEAEGFAWLVGPLHSVALSADRCSVIGGSVAFETQHIVRPRAWLGQLLTRLRRSAAYLGGEGTVVDALQAAYGSPTAAIRIRSVALLMAQAPDDVRITAIRALIDPDPKVRLFGALRVGALGWAVLRDLVHDAELSLEDRQRALAFMMERFDPALLLPMLVEVVEAAPAPLAVAAIRALGEQGDMATANRLRGWMVSGGPRAAAAQDALRRLLWRLGDRRGALSVVSKGTGELSESAPSGPDEPAST